MTFHRRPLGFETLESRRVLSGVANPVLADTVFVNVPDNLTGSPGQQVIAPVSIDNAAGLRGVEIRINYDTLVFDVETSSVLLGSVWDDTDAEVMANVDDATGSIVAWVFTSEGPSHGTGSLITVQFAVRNDAPIGGSSRIDLERVQLNEGDIEADPGPIPGPDSTDGRITLVISEQTARASGTVYADTNENDQPDSSEGIPRVRIVLTSLDGGQQRETLTDDSGRYEFRDLAAGSYRVVQQQPAAFIDGGSNELSVQVTAGQELSGQNFRERGLRPEYVYNRLFSTPVMPVGSTNWISAVRRIVGDADEAASETSSLPVISSAQNPVSSTASVTPAKSQATTGETLTPLPVAASQPAKVTAPPDGVLATRERLQSRPEMLAATFGERDPNCPGTAVGTSRSTRALSVSTPSVAVPAVLPIQPDVPVVPSLPALSASTAAVSVPDDITVEPGQQIVVPVNIDNPAGVRGVEIAINYDTLLLNTDSSGVLLGPLWAGTDAEVVANVNNATGSIVAWIFASEGLEAGSGSLLEVRFDANSEAPVGTATSIDLVRVRMNEGEIAANPDPVPGSDSTDGQVTFVAIERTARVSGTVYADVNANNQADPSEGIPRVRIVLTPADDGEQRTAYTDDTGSYQISDLAAGSYRIEQPQPAAFLDGGPNELSVQITTGQQLAGQNFREQGLRPEYVYNRLFSTAALPVGSVSWTNTVRSIVDDAEMAADDSEELGQLLAVDRAKASRNAARVQSVDLVFDNSSNWLDS